MSRGLGVVAKLAFFVLVVVVGVFVFRRAPASADRVQADVRAVVPAVEAVPGCAERVQADIRVFMPWLEPKVDRCEGSPTRATCSVETNARNGRRTAPVKDWDCTERHVIESQRRKWVWPKESAARAAVDREIAAWDAQVKDENERGRRYVVGKMSERQQALGEPDPSPRVAGSRAE